MKHKFEVGDEVTHIGFNYTELIILEVTSERYTVLFTDVNIKSYYPRFSFERDFRKVSNLERALK